MSRYCFPFAFRNEFVACRGSGSTVKKVRFSGEQKITLTGLKPFGIGGIISPVRKFYLFSEVLQRLDLSKAMFFTEFCVLAGVQDLEEDKLLGAFAVGEKRFCRFQESVVVKTHEELWQLRTLCRLLQL